MDPTSSSPGHDESGPNVSSFCPLNKADLTRIDILARPTVRHLLATGIYAARTGNEKMLKRLEQKLCCLLLDTVDPTMTKEEWRAYIDKLIDGHWPNLQEDVENFNSVGQDLPIFYDVYKRCHLITKLLKYNFGSLPKPIASRALKYTPTDRIIQLSKPRQYPYVPDRSMSELRLRAQNINPRGHIFKRQLAPQEPRYPTLSANDLNLSITQPVKRQSIPRSSMRQSALHYVTLSSETMPKAVQRSSVQRPSYNKGLRRSSLQSKTLRPKMYPQTMQHQLPLMQRPDHEKLRQFNQTEMITQASHNNTARHSSLVRNGLQRGTLSPQTAQENAGLYRDSSNESPGTSPLLPIHGISQQMEKTRMIQQTVEPKTIRHSSLEPTGVQNKTLPLENIMETDLRPHRPQIRQLQTLAIKVSLQHESKLDVRPCTNCSSSESIKNQPTGVSSQILNTDLLPDATQRQSQTIQLSFRDQSTQTDPLVSKILCTSCESIDDSLQNENSSPKANALSVSLSEECSACSTTDSFEDYCNAPCSQQQQKLAKKPSFRRSILKTDSISSTFLQSIQRPPLPTRRSYGNRISFINLKSSKSEDASNAKQQRNPYTPEMLEKLDTPSEVKSDNQKPLVRQSSTVSIKSLGSLSDQSSSCCSDSILFQQAIPNESQQQKSSSVPTPLKTFTLSPETVSVTVQQRKQPDVQPFPTLSIHLSLRYQSISAIEVLDQPNIGQNGLEDKSTTSPPEQCLNCSKSIPPPKPRPKEPISQILNPEVLRQKKQHQTRSIELSDVDEEEILQEFDTAPPEMQKQSTTIQNKNTSVPDLSSESSESQSGLQYESLPQPSNIDQVVQPTQFRQSISGRSTLPARRSYVARIAFKSQEKAQILTHETGSALRASQTASLIIVHSSTVWIESVNVYPRQPSSFSSDTIEGQRSKQNDLQQPASKYSETSPPTKTILPPSGPVKRSKFTYFETETSPDNLHQTNRRLSDLERRSEYNGSSLDGNRTSPQIEIISECCSSCFSADSLEPSATLEQTEKKQDVNPSLEIVSIFAGRLSVGRQRKHQLSSIVTSDPEYSPFQTKTNQPEILPKRYTSLEMLQSESDSNSEQCSDSSSCDSNSSECESLMICNSYEILELHKSSLSIKSSQSLVAVSSICSNVDSITEFPFQSTEIQKSSTEYSSDM